MDILNGKIAAITGGSRGIGRGIAEAYLKAGAKVVINGRNQDKGDQAIKEMDAGDRAIFIAGDVTSKKDVQAFIQGTIDRFGHIDILVNNAGGTSGFAPVAETSDEVWEHTQNWILNSTFWATRAALKHMEPRGSGRIINISSMDGRQVNKVNVSAYITHKHAMNGFTKAVAFEYGAKGITSNAIGPGAVETDLMKVNGPVLAKTTGITYEQFKDSFAQVAAINRIIKVEEVAAVALLLASPEGAGITGAIIPVDGGSVI